MYNGIGDSRKLQWILADITKGNKVPPKLIVLKSILDDIKKLATMYENDFQLYGYSFNFENNELEGLID